MTTSLVTTLEQEGDVVSLDNGKWGSNGLNGHAFGIWKRQDKYEEDEACGDGCKYIIICNYAYYLTYEILKCSLLTQFLLLASTSSSASSGSGARSNARSGRMRSQRRNRSRN